MNKMLEPAGPCGAQILPGPRAPKGQLVVSSVEGMDWRDSRERDYSLSFGRV